MNCKAILLFIFAIVLSTAYAWSQDALHRDEPKESRLLGKYSEGSLLTSEYHRINGKDISVFNDHVEFSDERTGERKKMNLEDLSIVNVTTGNYALAGLGLGALGGAVLPLSFRDAHNYLPSGEVFLISTAVCAGIGLLIGASMDTHKIIYQTGTLFIAAGGRRAEPLPKLGFSSTNLINIVITLK